MPSNNSENYDLKRDLKNIWHPCTQMKEHESEPPLLIEKGDGIYLIDRNGKRYIDVISSWWVNLFGHNHPHLNKAIKNQLDQMAHVMFAGITHAPAINLAETLVELTPPNLTKVFFSDNGSTSVEIALKMSLQYWQQSGEKQRTKFIYLSGGYHGETLGALSVCGINLFREKFNGVLMQNLEVQGPDCYRCPYDLKPDSCQAECFEHLEKTLNENRGSVAGVIVEPLVQGAAGMKIYSPVYLKKLQEACEDSQTHTIYDEVAVGFGRTGSLFVCDSHGLKPTFLCLSKGITSGYLPLAATLTSDLIYQAFYGEHASMKLFVHSHSYSANPLACACANETLSLLTQNNFLENLKPKIKFIGETGSVFNEYKWCGEFRHKGMIAAIELVRDKLSKDTFHLKDRVG
ncbi:MAG: adenosylmethionine--8-amino-7-oxononanoate transaminase, partial [Nitrospina sp.]|nr:adenosylmethionine--8-amino-7-oxononanoate transaminase [Nitrospina sp.]